MPQAAPNIPRRQSHPQVRSTALEKGGPMAQWGSPWQRQTTLTLLWTRVTHTLTLNGWPKEKCVCVCVCVCSSNSITSLPAALYSMPNFQQNMTGHVKSKKNQLELYFQNGSLGSSTDPFPSETSVTHEIYFKHLNI